MSGLKDRKAVRERHDTPVTIVGAGPAGLACAIALARNGRHVVVREWHAGVGHRFHGDFQGLENWSSDQDVLDELRANGIDPSFEYHAVYRATMFDSRGRFYHAQSARPLYYLVRRGSLVGMLDHALLAQATAAGVEIRFADRAATIDGPAVLAGGPRIADAIAVGYLFETEMPDGDWLALDNQLAPLGYAYLLVHGGRGTVASCMFTGFKKQDEHVERTVLFFREKVGLVMRSPRRIRRFRQFPPAAHGKPGRALGYWRAGRLPGRPRRFRHALRLAVGTARGTEHPRPGGLYAAVAQGASPAPPRRYGKPLCLQHRGRARLAPRTREAERG